MLHIKLNAKFGPVFDSLRQPGWCLLRLSKKLVTENLRMLEAQA